MKRQIVPHYAKRSQAHDDYLAQLPTERSSQASKSIPPAFITVILGPQSLRVRVRQQDSSSSELFNRWKDCEGIQRDSLPAVIAYNSRGGLQFGYHAIHHPRRIENLQELLEASVSSVLPQMGTKRQLIVNSRRRAVQVVGEFLCSALQHVDRYFESREYTFIVPSRWSEQEVGLYAEAIEMSIRNQPFKFLDGIEAGAFWMVRRLREIGAPSGVVFLMNSQELETPIRRVAYVAVDGPSQLRQLPGSMIISSDAPFERLAFKWSQDEVEEFRQGLYVVVFEGPEEALAHFIRANPPGRPRSPDSPFNNVEEVISTADEYLEGDAQEQLSVRRLLKKSYGVNSRVKFKETEHRPEQRGLDYDDQPWCNNVIRWMAYKDSPLDILDQEIRKQFHQEFSYNGPFNANEYLYALDADKAEISRRKCWYNDDTGIKEVCKLQVDVGNMPHTVVPGQFGGIHKLYKRFEYILRLSFGNNGVLGFVLESVDGGEYGREAAAFSTIE